ncbi:DUF1003 domain-containing protein [Pararhizobium haloflavum]|uniref:DUF1003 domain-containing protein n=1 Tax=Pararhizobium haloflavum TaxID=2037914 RepID=UPI000C182E6B|nr:DUF1003 domain-containing protein [Pararhizobium haloflavum]
MKPGQETCGVCGRHGSAVRLYSTAWLRPTVAQWLDREYPGWRDTGWLCIEDLQRARRHVLEETIIKERGELTALDSTVVTSLIQDETLSVDIERDYEEKVSLAERSADAVAAYVGSWQFIFTFIAVLIVWMSANAWLLRTDAFDPYPFILLNLFLSLVAAIQAPLIMMSQRRQETKDRLRSQNDYQVNLKAELEIRHLHEKLDHHLLRQWERLTEIQEMQMELIDDTVAVGPSDPATAKRRSRLKRQSAARRAD